MAEHWIVTERRKRRIVEYYVYKNSTVRKTAEYFGVSKSYVHRVISEFQQNGLLRDNSLAKEVKAQVDKNIKERAVRGGITTKERYFTNKK